MRWFGWLRRKSQEEDASAGGADARGMIAGRMRTRGAPYLLPYDMEELNRLDFQHYMLRAVFRGNYAAPITAPANILDVGAGTGRWAREMAAMFPRAQVLGIDINPPPADDERDARDEPRPENVTFMPGNILEGLAFPDASFDFVHQRALIGAIPHDYWPRVASELTRLTRPGGWVESLEVTELHECGPATSQLVAWLTAVLARRGMDFADGGRVADYLRLAGLERVTLRTASLPCGEWGGRAGRMLAADWFSLFGATSGFMRQLGLATEDQIAATSNAASAELASPAGRCSMPAYIAFGQRRG